MSFNNNFGHLETIPESEPSYSYQAKKYGNNCEQRKFYLEAHQKAKPWRCVLPWSTDLRCTQGFYTDQLDSILQQSNLGPANCANMDQRWENFKLKVGIGSVLTLGVGAFLLFKILD